MSNQFNLDANEVERALELHQKSVVIDSSTAIIANWAQIHGRAHFTEALNAGITAVSNTVPLPSANLHEAVSQIEDWYAVIEKYEDQINLVLTVEDIRRAKREGKVGIIFGPQNAAMIEDNIGLVKIFSKLGVRICQLTYNERNLLGDGCTERTQGGLTDFGVAAVEEMNRQGIVIDLSHTSDAVVADAIEFSKDPMAFTHANARALNGNLRNKTDEHIQALAEKGGVIGLSAWSPMAHTKLGVRPTLDDYFTHLDHIVELVGIDHAGIGSDFNFGDTVTEEDWERYRIRYPQVCGPWTLVTRVVRGFNAVKHFPDVTKGLVAHGYSDQEIQKFLGGNFLKLFKSVWRD